MIIVFLRDIINEHKSFGKRIFVLAKTELVKTYKGAAIGPLWAVVKPAFTLFVYWFAFTIGIKKLGQVEVLIHNHTLSFDRFLFMLVGFIPWFFISESITKGAKDIRSHRQYVTKINFPVSTIMTFTSLSRIYVHLALSFIMYIIVAFMWGTSWYNLQYFFYMPIMFLFFLFLSWTTAPMCAFSPDLENAIVSIMSGIFWLTGVIYNSYDLPAPLDKIMLFNPINFFVNGYRNAFLYDRFFFEFKTEFFIFLAEFIVLFILGVYNYNRLRKKIPDVL
ncbi:MAG: ABC transporter permease [Ruminococcus sp.]|jgi:ABC-type polysaccharide/polyol phosphate export permease|nr:ABC transporter permease [Ruminococcus sp.]